MTTSQEPAKDRFAELNELYLKRACEVQGLSQVKFARKWWDRDRQVVTQPSTAGAKYATYSYVLKFAKVADLTTEEAALLKREWLKVRICGTEWGPAVQVLLEALEETVAPQKFDELIDLAFSRYLVRKEKTKS